MVNYLAPPPFSWIHWKTIYKSRIAISLCTEKGMFYDTETTVWNLSECYWCFKRCLLSCLLPVFLYFKFGLIFFTTTYLHNILYTDSQINTHTNISTNIQTDIILIFRFLIPKNHVNLSNTRSQKFVWLPKFPILTK